MADEPPAELSSLPAAYEAWRASALGRITDRLEEDLILGLIGPVQGKRVLDVGCGDGVLSVRLALDGADVTGLDANPRMLDAGRDRASKSRVAVTYLLWAAKRRLSGWLGSRTWRAAFFRSTGELKRIAASAKLDVTAIRGAIYYPPNDLCARWLAPLDRHLATVTTTGAAFIALSAEKPANKP